jgi:basic membrane protein A
MNGRTVPHPRGLLALALAAVALLAAACGGSDTKTESKSASPAAAGSAAPAAAGAKNLKVGFLYVGSVDDAGYNQAAYQGQQAVAKMDGVETIKAENVPENAEAERVMEQMIQQGATIIFPTSYGHLDPALKVAAKYPNVTFLHEGGLKTAPNLGTFFGTIWQGQYVSGIAAGRMTKTSKLGFVAAFPIPQTLLNINAFTLGARSVNPAVTTTVIFTGNWCDAGKNVEAVKSLVDQKVDVVTQHQDCTIPIVQAAEKAGIMTVGYHADASKFASNGWITAPIWDWTKLFPDLVNQVRSGTYKPDLWRGGLKEGTVTLAPFGKNVPKAVQDEVQAVKTKMEGGDLSVFKGPIKDQDGKVRIKEGETPTVAQLEASDYLVEGVIGKIPS